MEPDMPIPAIPSSPITPSAKAGKSHTVLMVGAAVWAFLVCAGVQVGGWFITQSLLVSGIEWPAWAWVPAVWGQFFLIALPVLPLALFLRPSPQRTIFRVWTIALAFSAWAALARIVPETQTQLATAIQAGLALVGSVALGFLLLIRRRKAPAGGRALPLTLALAAFCAWPTLALGALGSPLDSALALLAGLALGLFAGPLLSAFLTAPLRAAGLAARTIGFAASVALFLIAAGFGYGGQQLLLMLALPPLGYLLTTLDKWDAGGWLPAAVLVGLGTAMPLALVDPDELTILLGGHEILDWALRAVFYTVLAILIANGLILLAKKRLSKRLSPAFGLIMTALVMGAGAAIYFGLGQPGFYGEQFFVVLRDQADVSQAVQIVDRSTRLRYVYDTLTRHAEETQAGLRAELDQAGVDYTPYYLVNALEVDGGPLLRARLARRPEVDRILDSPHLRPLPRPVPTMEGSSEAPVELPWNITAIGADRVWRDLGVTGEGIVIGQSDSGVDGAHPALAGSYRGAINQSDAYNWLDPWNHTASPTDIGGHGTHTLGSILGQGGIGVAPGARWFACTNLARNVSNPALYTTCMQFMLAPYPQDGDPFEEGDPSLAAHVLNNSWGCPPFEGCDAEVLQPAARALRQAGIFVVASAGNEGPLCGSVSDPIALYDEVFTVGAISPNDSLAFFSSRGPVMADGSERIKPDVVAPGAEVLSATPGGSYDIMEGTSMAGPHVAGVVALIWSAQPHLIGDIEGTEKILQQTTRAISGEPDACAGSGTPNSAAGYGIVDAYAAVQAALALP